MDKKALKNTKNTNSEKKKINGGSIITSAVFLALIFGFSIAGVLSPDREFSDMENRSLQQVPEFSLERLKDGKFTSEIETYMSDQVFMKDELVELKTAVDTAFRKTYQNGVYFGRNGYYIQDYQENRALVQNNVKMLNDFADSLDDDVHVSFLLAPNAVSVLSDKLPSVTQTDDQLETVDLIKNSLSDRITFCCPYDELKQADEDGKQVFYKTDHHWTEDGAETGFNALMTAMGESIPDTPYSDENVSGFYGTLYSKAPQFSAESDTVKLVYGLNNDITVTYVDGESDVSLMNTVDDFELKDGDVVRKSLYVKAQTEKKDKYAAYLGGNFKLIQLETQGESDENVLVIKDSYANAVMPFLCQKYQHISMIDLRYYHMEDLSVSDYVKEHNIKKVIYLYNVDFINSDNNFVWLD